MNQEIPLCFVVFGATGDLAQKKILPALLALWKAKKVPADFTVIAFSRRPWTDSDFRNFICPALELKESDESTVTEFLKKIEYVEGTFDDPQGYRRLAEKIDSHKARAIYHLSIQPEFYEKVFHGLGASGNNSDSRIIIEKPFGHDLPSAQALEKTLETYFSEEQIYRIDHFLGKQGLQDLIKKRMSDREFEARLTKDHVTAISIRILEQLDIQGRGEFYDAVGALNDVGQNHALEMLAMATMDLDAHRADVLSRLGVPLSSILVRGQYQGYTQEQDVQPDSQTETYFSIAAEIQNDRWNGVPITIEGGKSLQEKRSEIGISFKEGVEVVFNIEQTLSAEKRDAYEILIEHAMNQNHALFVSNAEVEASWHYVDAVKKELQKMPMKIYKKNIYPLEFL